MLNGSFSLFLHPEAAQYRIPLKTITSVAPVPRDTTQPAGRLLISNGDKNHKTPFSVLASLGQSP